MKAIGVKLDRDRGLCWKSPPHLGMKECRSEER